MRRAVRAIVVKDGQLLVMHRNKFGHEYYCLVGGGIDPGETPEQALARELHEESGIQVANPRLVIIEEAGNPFGTQYVYLCDFVAGEPALHPESEEAQIHAMGQNLHTPMWLSIEALASAPEFRTEQMRQAVLDGLRHGFEPANPVTIHSN